MGVGKLVLKQYQDKVNQAVKAFGGLSSPPEGWIRTVRKALGMPGLQLANRLGVTKARVSRAEHDEVTGSVTLKSMQNMAKAMNCRFVYAILPEQEIGALIKMQAVEKAKVQVKAASVHMALEDQQLDNRLLASEVDRIATEIAQNMPADLWNVQ